MKYWTIQSPKALQQIERESIYYPRFAMSNYYKEYHELYDFMLYSFNKVNGLNCDGLIFAFCVSFKDQIYPINDIEDFKSIVNYNASKVNCLWDTFL